jgi:hypothetical protein
MAPALGAWVKLAPEKPILHFVSAFERGARRQLHGDDDVAAVELGDEAGRRLPKFEEAQAEHRSIDEQHQGGKPQHPPDQPPIALGELPEATVEQREEAENRTQQQWLGPIVMRTQQQRA